MKLRRRERGPDPRRFSDRHDKAQWEKLTSLPNLIYTDGNEFSIWRNGEIEGEPVRLVDEVQMSGVDLSAPPSLPGLFEDFIRWQPIPPRDANQLAQIGARLCRLLRDEVTEQLSPGSPALTALATDWRKLLFPEASDAQFADGYAQAVTSGMLMARARAPYQSVQIRGDALKIRSARLKEEFTQRSHLQRLLLRYMHWLLTQITQSALCNRFHSVEERLCRWLLLSRDHAGSDTLHLTQEFLSQILGTPRTNVTMIAGAIQRMGLNCRGRGKVMFVDRPGLEAASCECYRIFNREIAQLIAL